MNPIKITTTRSLTTPLHDLTAAHLAALIDQGDPGDKIAVTIDHDDMRGPNHITFKITNTGIGAEL